MVNKVMENHLRRWMRLVENGDRHTRLLQYLKGEKFDLYKHAGDLELWLTHHREYRELLSEITGRPKIDLVYSPSLFYKFPKDVQTEAIAWVYEWLTRNSPEEAPSNQYLTLSNDNLIPGTTWLVHFTDEPDAIAKNGFTIGMVDHTKLGLTTYHSNTNRDKRSGGYNFAFEADSADAASASREHKYGEDAVMFQSSGVACYHVTDNEEQIIFNGQDVDPRKIVILRRYEDSWQVKSYNGGFEDCVKWVQVNGVG